MRLNMDIQKIVNALNSIKDESFYLITASMNNYNESEERSIHLSEECFKRLFAEYETEAHSDIKNCIFVFIDGVKIFSLEAK
jgi:plasmid replication initiation protein